MDGYPQREDDHRQLTQLSAVSIALGVVLALAVLVILAWRGRVRRLNREKPEAQYRRDIQALKRQWTSLGASIWRVEIQAAVTKLVQAYGTDDM